MMTPIHATWAASPERPPPAAAFAFPLEIDLAANLRGLAFPLMKILPALRLVAAAPPDAGIIETSSGTMALALAMVCAAQGRALTLVMPPLEPSLRRHLRALGDTRVVTTAAHDRPGGNQGARLRRLRSLLRDDPRLVWTRQYENPLVPASYEPVGRLLADAAADCVVAPVGSGGSAVGIARALRRGRPRAHLVAVDSANSVLFGRPDGPRAFPGMGNSLVPRAFDRAAFDEVHWLSDACIAEATRSLTRETGLLLGPSGGAAVLVARWWARRHPRRRVACVIPEAGTRYLETLYGDGRLGRLGLPGGVPQAPVFVAGSATGAGHWLATTLRPVPTPTGGEP